MNVPPNLRSARAPRRCRGERGVSLVEYSLFLSLVVLVTIASIGAFGDRAGDRLQDSSDDIGAERTSISGVAPVTVPPPPGNAAPAAAFSVTCTKLDCSFIDTSVDSDGTIVARSWQFGDGWTATIERPGHRYASSGSYTVTLTVEDDEGDTGTWSQVVPVIANVSPTASFTSTCTELTCSFQDTSNDGDGSITAHRWDFGDGQTSTAIAPTHAFASGGRYTVALTVEDDDGARATTSRTVDAVPPNVPPTAMFTVSCTHLRCDFTDASSDTDGSIDSRSWTFGDGGTSKSRNPTRTYVTAGTRTVSLTVTDDAGASHTATRDVTVVANAAPTANFTASCVELTCTFKDASGDSDGTIVSRSWDFGDGGTSTTRNPTRTYANAGTRTVRLTVTDDDGATATRTRQVTTTAPPPVRASVSTRSEDVSWWIFYLYTRYEATVTVTSSGAGVPDVVVTGRWTPDGPALSCTTEASGSCSPGPWTSDRGRKTFTVTDVDHSRWDGVRSSDSTG
ncbi:MAG TPA: hypothetical protein DCS55_05280 [Acidimicrobiaceae bacterium]|nr:hypothetical protein [Acidimicrobiaceae bacterium]